MDVVSAIYGDTLHQGKSNEMTTEDKDNSNTPKKVRDLLKYITDGEWQAIRAHCLCGMCPFGSVKVIISATEVETIAEEVCSRSNADLIAAAPDIARAYLKLHEENTRLRNVLEIYAEGCQIARNALKEQPK